MKTVAYDPVSTMHDTKQRHPVLWIVGKTIGDSELGRVWEFQGVFSTKEKAIDACNDINDFVGPTNLDWTWPQDTVEWPGCYYPLAERVANAG